MAEGHTPRASLGLVVVAVQVAGAPTQTLVLPVEA
jgi:hypothetical protein